MDDFHSKKEINEYTFEITITIPKDSFKKSYDLLLEEYAEKLDIKGFRKGKVPTNLISDQVKEVTKLETLEKIAPLYITTALQKENLAPIAPPQYKEIPKIVENTDTSFTIVVTIMPKFKLGDLKKIKIEKQAIEITKEEIDKALEELRSTQTTKTKEMNDKWAKEVSITLEQKGITTLEQLKKKIKELLYKQKEHFQFHKMQDEALKLAITESEINIPQVAIDFEAQEREKTFNENIKEKKLNIDEFLKTNNITIEKMRELWNRDAKEAIETDVFLTLYADTKKIEITEEALNKKINEIKKQRPDVDRTVFSDPQWREYIKNIERKEKAFSSFAEEIFGKDFISKYN